MLGQSASLPPVVSPRSHEDLLNLIALVTDPDKAREALARLGEAQKAHDERSANLSEQERRLSAQDADLRDQMSAHQANVEAHLKKAADAERGWADLEARRQSFAAERQKLLDATAAEKANLEAGRRDLAGQVLAHSRACAALAAREMAADQRNAAAAQREEAVQKGEADLAAKRAKLAKAISE